MSDKYMPLEGGELSQLQFIYSLYRVLKDDDSLKPRLSSLNMWRRYCGLIKQLHNLFDSLWRTIDPAKRDRINQIWSRQELRVVNSAQAVDPTGDTLQVPKSAVLLMGSICAKEKCAICMGDHQERKDCQFRRAMLGLAIPDLRREEKRSGKCVGKIFVWEEIK